MPPNHVLEDERYEALDSAIANNSQALAIAVSFRDYPKGLRKYTIAPNYMDTLLPETQETRIVERLLDLAAERERPDGRAREHSLTFPR